MLSFIRPAGLAALAIATLMGVCVASGMGAPPDASTSSPFPTSPPWLRDYQPILNRDSRVVAVAYRDGSAYVLSHVPAGTVRVSGFDPGELPQTGTGDILLTRCDARTGVVRWRYVFDSEERGQEIPTLLTVAGNGNLVIGGTTDAGKANSGRVPFANDATHLLVLTVSPDGKLLWTARGRSETVGVVDPPFGMAVGKSGAVYVSSRLFVELGQRSDGVLVKFVPNRVAWWTGLDTKGIALQCEPGEVVADDDENVTVCGSVRLTAAATAAASGRSHRLFLARFTAEGKPRWQRFFVFRGKQDAGLHLLARDPVTGSFFAAGGSGVIRLDARGEIVWKAESSDTFAKSAAAIIRPERLALSNSGAVSLLYRTTPTGLYTGDTSRVMRFDAASGAVIPTPPTP